MYQTLEQIVFIFAKIEISSKKMFKADKQIKVFSSYIVTWISSKKNGKSPGMEQLRRAFR